MEPILGSCSSTHVSHQRGRDWDLCSHGGGSRWFRSPADAKAAEAQSVFDDGVEGYGADDEEYGVEGREDGQPFGVGQHSLSGQNASA